MMIDPQIPAKSSVVSLALTPLLPPPIVVVERRSPGDSADLMAAEARYVAQARPKRIQEFAAGRACARQALARFGVSPVAVLAGPDRRPLWPADYVGSITHTAGFCAAAVARADQITALGLDTEIVGAPTRDIWSTICREEELAWIESLPLVERPAAVTLLFSAKEAFYKAQYPLTTEWLDFHDVHVETSDYGRHSGVFEARATRNIRFARLVPLPISGRYVFHEQFVSAGIAVTAAQ